MVMTNRTADYRKLAGKVLEILNEVPEDDELICGIPVSKEEAKQDEFGRYKNDLKHHVRAGLKQAFEQLSALQIAMEEEHE